MEITPLFPPAELTSFINRILEDQTINDHHGEEIFPNAFTGSDSWTTGLQSARDYTEEAEYRSWNTESSIGSRPGLFRITGNIVPMSRKLPLPEETIRLLKNAGTMGVPDIVRTKIYDDASTLIRQVRNRVERARWEVLDKATFTIGNPGGATYPATEHGLQMHVDYLRDSGNRFAVSTKWDQGGSDPLTDELNLMQAASDKGIDLAGGAMYASLSIITTLCLNSVYRNAYNSIRAQARLTPQQLNEVRQEWGLPRIVRMDAKGKRRGTSADVTAAFLDPKRAVFVPANQVGQTLWGPSSYVGEDGIGLTGSNGGPVLFVGRTIDPLTYWTVIDAPVIPVLFQPNDTYSVLVLT
jgi:hypothetical protein